MFKFSGMQGIRTPVGDNHTVESTEVTFLPIPTRPSSMLALVGCHVKS